MLHLSREHRVLAVVSFIVPIVLVLLIAVILSDAGVQVSFPANAACSSCGGDAACVEDPRCGQ